MEIDNELVRMKDAFARLRDEAIGDQSLDEAIEVGKKIVKLADD